MNMKRCDIGSSRFVIGILTTVLGIAATAQAGPPLICHAINIGQAKSLPWPGNAWNLSGNENYNPANLVSDTLAILNPATPVLVRMETLRRATLYARKDPILAKELLIRLYQRTTEAAGRTNGLAWFDAGYLAACY
ncbi:MAG: hypothetical protein ACRD3T_19380, partial [Terriglobia bacterium]